MAGGNTSSSSSVNESGFEDLITNWVNAVQDGVALGAAQLAVALLVGLLLIALVVTVTFWVLRRVAR